MYEVCEIEPPKRKPVVRRKRAWEVAVYRDYEPHPFEDADPSAIYAPVRGCALCGAPYGARHHR